MGAKAPRICSTVTPCSSSHGISSARSARRLVVETVKQAQRLDIDVSHSANLIRVGHAGAEEFHFALDALEVATARKRPRKAVGLCNRLPD